MFLFCASPPYCITNNRRFPSGEKNAYTQKSFHLTRSKKILSHSDSVIVTPHAMLWQQQTAEQHKIPQNICACLHKLKKRRNDNSSVKTVTWSSKYIEGLKEERIPVEWHVGACRQARVRNAEFRSLWLHLPHIKKHWSYSRARPNHHPRLHTFSHIRTTLTAWFLSLALAFAFKQHIQTHTCNNQHVLWVIQTCGALDCRAGSDVLCTISYDSTAKSPHTFL